MSQKILITGGLGYIGSHTAVACVQKGFDVVLADNLSNTSLTVLAEIEEIVGKKVLFYEVSVHNPDTFETVFQKNLDIDGVIHCAGIKSLGESHEDSFLYYDNNVGGTIHLCSLLHKYAIKKIIYASASSLYSSDKIAPPFAESDPCVLTNSFMTTTYMVENMLKDMSAHHGFFFALSLRLAKVIGAHHSGLLGSRWTMTPSDLVGSLYATALHGQPPLTVFGNDYHTVDGTCIRDYVHVVDVAQSFVSSYIYLSDLLQQAKQTEESTAGFFDIFNVGSGTGLSVLEMIALGEKVTGKKIPYVVAERKKGDKPVNIVSIDKIYRALGWEPEFTPYRAVADGRKFVQSQRY